MTKCGFLLNLYHYIKCRKKKNKVKQNFFSDGKTQKNTPGVRSGCYLITISFLLINRLPLARSQFELHAAVGAAALAGSIQCNRAVFAVGVDADALGIDPAAD